MKLTPYLDARRVVVHLAVDSREALLRSLGALAVQGTSTDPAVAFQQLLVREQQCSTGIGRGLAVPHATIEGLEETRVALVTLATPIAYDAVDGAPIRIAIAVLSPPGRADEHLGLLARIARLFSMKALCERLITAATPEALMREVRMEDERHVG